MLIRTTLDGIETAGQIEFFFLKLVYNSLLNDYISKCIKVFERGTQAASFWYIYKTNEKIFLKIAKKREIEVSIFDEITPKLKHLRDKTHFHLDTEGIMDINEVWLTANITKQELHSCVSSAQLILCDLATELNLKRETMPKEYNAIIPYRIATVINSGNW
jgi:hypothetical protein